MRIVWQDLPDLPDLVEIETRVSYCGWGGVVRTYAGLDDLSTKISLLERWGQRPEGEFTLEFGNDDAVQLKFAVLNLAREIACVVTLRDRPVDFNRYHADGNRVSVLIPIELSMLDWFVRDLRSLTETAKGVAGF